ncbi:MAG: hypothetical protein RLW87_03520 [Alphaproteobacteria bacterium]
MSDVNETAVLSKIPVFGSVGFAFSQGVAKYPTYLKVAWLPALVAAAALTLPSYGLPFLLPEGIPTHQTFDTFGGLLGSPLLPIALAAIILQVVLAIPLYAVWYRLAAMGPEFALGGSRWPFGARERRLLLASLFLALCFTVFGVSLFVVLPELGSGAMAVLVMLVALVAYGYCIGRMIPLLVGAAVGDEVSVSESWQITRGQAWRILLSGIVLILCTLIVFTIIGFVIALGGGLVTVIFASMLGNPGAFVGQLIVDIVLTFLVILPSLAVYCCFQSGIYGRLRERLLALRDRHPA